MAACEKGNYDFTEWLLRKGAVVNKVMLSGWTAMHAAAKNDHAKVLGLLLQNGGDPNLPAIHRNYGRNLAVEDVTSDENTLRVIQCVPKKQKEVWQWCRTCF